MLRPSCKCPHVLVSSSGGFCTAVTVSIFDPRRGQNHNISEWSGRTCSFSWGLVCLFETQRMQSKNKTMHWKRSIKNLHLLEWWSIYECNLNLVSLPKILNNGSISISITKPEPLHIQYPHLMCGTQSTLRLLLSHAPSCPSAKKTTTFTAAKLHPRYDFTTQLLNGTLVLRHIFALVT